MWQNVAIDRALALVTCASATDVAGARAVLAECQGAELDAVALNLAGMCWSAFERLGSASGIEPLALFRMFAAGCQASRGA